MNFSLDSDAYECLTVCNMRKNKNLRGLRKYVISYLILMIEDVVLEAMRRWHLFIYLFFNKY